MYSKGVVCMPFNFGEEILIIKDSPKLVLYLFWWV